MQITETAREIDKALGDQQTVPQTFEKRLVDLIHGDVPVTEEMIAQLPRNPKPSPMSLIRTHLLFVTRGPRQRIHNTTEAIRSVAFGNPNRETVLFQNNEETSQRA